MRRALMADVAEKELRWMTLAAGQVRQQRSFRIACSTEALFFP